MRKGFQRDLGIAVAFECLPERFEFLAQCGVIIDLAVEHDGKVARGGKHGLIAARKVDDFQPHRPDGGMAGVVAAGLVRTPVTDRLEGAAENLRIGPVAEMSEARYAAHKAKPSLEKMAGDRSVAALNALITAADG